jgi:hypothetical protein
LGAMRILGFRGRVVKTTDGCLAGLDGQYLHRPFSNDAVHLNTWKIAGLSRRMIRKNQISPYCGI